MLCFAALPLPAALAWQPNASVDDARKKVKDGKYEEAITSLEAEHKKNPKNAAVKTALSEAYAAQGESIMMNAQLPPFRKYPQSLKLFRRAVEVDAANKKAKGHIDTIEGIYRQMGREVPK